MVTLLMNFWSVYEDDGLVPFSRPFHIPSEMLQWPILHFSISNQLKRVYIEKQVLPLV